MKRKVITDTRNFHRFDNSVPVALLEERWGRSLVVAGSKPDVTLC